MPPFTIQVLERFVYGTKFMSTDRNRKNEFTTENVRDLFPETQPANVVRKGILKNIIPSLYSEKDNLIEKLNQQLKENDPLNQTKGKRYTHREAVLIAVEKVGGKTFKEIKDELLLIEKREKELDKKVSSLEKNKGWTFTFRPRALGELKELKSELETLNKSYNEKVMDYNWHIERLNSPEKQAEIKREAESILVSNTRDLILSASLKKAIKDVNKDISHLTNIEVQLKRLGNTPIEVKKEAFTVNNKSFDVPVPADNQEIKRLTLVKKDRKLTFK